MTDDGGPDVVAKPFFGPWRLARLGFAFAGVIVASGAFVAGMYAFTAASTLAGWVSAAMFMAGFGLLELSALTTSLYERLVAREIVVPETGPAEQAAATERWTGGEVTLRLGRPLEFTQRITMATGAISVFGAFAGVFALGGGVLVIANIAPVVVAAAFAAVFGVAFAVLVGVLYWASRTVLVRVSLGMVSVGAKDFRVVEISSIYLEDGRIVVVAMNGNLWRSRAVDVSDSAKLLRVLRLPLMTPGEHDDEAAARVRVNRQLKPLRESGP